MYVHRIRSIMATADGDGNRFYEDSINIEGKLTLKQIVFGQRGSWWPPSPHM